MSVFFYALPVDGRYAMFGQIAVALRKVVVAKPSATVG